MGSSQNGNTDAPTRCCEIIITDSSVVSKFLVVGCRRGRRLTNAGRAHRPSLRGAAGDVAISVRRPSLKAARNVEGPVMSLLFCPTCIGRQCNHLCHGAVFTDLLYSVVCKVCEKFFRREASQSNNAPKSAACNCFVVWDGQCYLGAFSCQDHVTPPLPDDRLANCLQQLSKFLPRENRDARR